MGGGGAAETLDLFHRKNVEFCDPVPEKNCKKSALFQTRPRNEVITPHHDKNTSRQDYITRHNEETTKHNEITTTRNE